MTTVHNNSPNLEEYFRKHSILLYTIGTIAISATALIDLFTLKERPVTIYFSNVPVIVIVCLAYIAFLLKKIKPKHGIVLICYLAIANIFFTQTFDTPDANFSLYFLRATIFYMVITTVLALTAHRINAFIILIVYYFLYIYTMFRTGDSFFLENITSILFTYLILSGILYIYSEKLRKVFSELIEKTGQYEAQNALLLVSNTELEERREELRKANKTLSKKNNKLLRREEQLKSSIASKDKFISIIAHDLKNPAQTLKGFLEILQKKYETAPKEKVVMYIKNARESSEHLNKLLIDLLEWSRTQDNGLRYEPRVFNLKKLTRNVIDFLNLTALHKGVALHEEVSEEINMHADYDMIFTIIRNLVSNSIKFSYKGGEITIRATDCEQFISIQVHDKGMGIEAAVVEKITKSDINYTSVGTNGEMGTGLGLKICRELVEKHKGKFTIVSEPNKETTISFEIPQNKPSIDK